MAANSKREQIIEYVVGQIKEIGELDGHVERVLLTQTDLENRPANWFPGAAVVGGLPVPVGHKPQRQTGGADVFRSQLDVVVFVYENVRDDPDTRISTLADDVWAKLWEDKTKGGLVYETDVFFESIPSWPRPYVSFNATCRLLYGHTTGGI